MKNILSKIPLFFILSIGLIFILSFSCSKRKGIEAPNITPDAPAGLTVLNQTTTTVTLSWQLAADKDGQVVGYNIYYSTVSGEYSQKANEDLIKSTNYNFTGMLSGYIYYFVVRSVDNQGVESRNSLEVSITGNASIANIVNYPVLNYPVNSTFLNSLVQIDITFTSSVTGADLKTNYVFSGTGAGTLSVSSVASLGGTTYSLTITGSPSNGAVVLTLSNIKDLSNNPISNNVINYVFDITSPIPGGSGLIEKLNVVSSGFQLSWNQASDNKTNPNLLMYKVVMSNDGSYIDTILEADGITGTGLIKDWTVNLTSINVSGLQVETNYYFTVLVKDEYGNKAIYNVKQAAILSAGKIDTTFDPGTGADGAIYAIVLQVDGKILIGGSFTNYNGTTRSRIARINANGTLDTTFNPGTGADATIYAIALQSDGKILIGGSFTNYNGTARSRIARINADGTLDATFNPGAGANNTINAIALQSDGKILIGGYFGSPYPFLARINSNGTLDTTFGGVNSPDFYVRAIQIKSNGQILIGGDFTNYNGTARKRIALVNSDGSLDANFDSSGGADNSINTIALQADGKILIGGSFTSYYGGPSRYKIARTNENGSFDSSFEPGLGANSDIYEQLINDDGQIIIVGVFTTYNGIVRKRIARVNLDGSLDTTFNPGTGADGSINSIALQSDGKIIIGGDFINYNGTSINRIIRIWHKIN